MESNPTEYLDNKLINEFIHPNVQQFSLTELDIPIDAQRLVSEYIHGIPSFDNGQIGFVNTQNELIHGIEYDSYSNSIINDGIPQLNTRYHKPVFDHEPYKIIHQRTSDDGFIRREFSPDGVVISKFNEHGYNTDIYRYDYNLNFMYLTSHIDNLNKIETVYNVHGIPTDQITLPGSSISGDDDDDWY